MSDEQQDDFMRQTIEDTMRDHGLGGAYDALLYHLELRCRDVPSAPSLLRSCDVDSR